ncbi:homeobox-leucine zipper protein REVOLUTA-like isoform X2 [Magnolia sinica]|uniref:homeobox-leucine zipper protein REVOLUTA-like isoform X2 n=1 Tax=Magnolia sinica TaxID=86752 RepID=UPI002659897C|nr:homeobox-leucine zipper protein REVOLUTA-like isoform X2 [Magnolia sinica]
MINNCFGIQLNQVIWVTGQTGPHPGIHQIQAVVGFEATALKDPGLNAGEEVQKMVNLLDKLDTSMKIAEILKDRLSWFQDCQCLEVFNMFPTGNRGTIELIYMQMYAPTTLAPPRDLWTLRYTTSLEDGSLVVCER